MELLFLYGPPASGKLTIAEEISKQTGLPIFHNHLTRDLVAEVFPDSLSENYQLVTDLRNNVFTYCAAHGHSVIFTWVYDGPDDDAALASMVDSVRSNGGTVRFVEIQASVEDLVKRVVQESRKRHKKLSDPDKLRDFMAKKPTVSVPYPDILIVDSSMRSPAESAQLIIDHFQLIS